MQGNMVTDSRDSWQELIKVYTNLQLSKPTDILSAISTIAESTCNMDPGGTSDDYKAGLWQQHMPFNLIWRIEPGERKPRPL